MKKIMMIDDNDELLTSINHALKGAIITEACHSAMEAVITIGMQQPDILLLDHQLSDKNDDGFEVVEWIKNNDLKIEIYSTTKNDEAKKVYAAMSIGWVDKNNLAVLKKIVADAQ